MKINEKLKQIIRNKWFWVLLGIFILTGLVIAYLILKTDTFGGRENKKSNNQSQENSQNKTAVIDTTDWITYTNPAAKFEIKYPPKNWEIQVVKGQDKNNTKTPGFRYCENLEGSGYLGFYTYDFKVEPNSRLEDLFLVLDLDRIIDQKFVTLGGERAMRTTFLRQRYTKPEEFIDVIHNERPYRIFPGQEPEEKCQAEPDRTHTYRELQEKILSTFKFLD